MRGSTPEFHWLRPNIFNWSACDPSVKADLYSTGIAIADATFFVDPIVISRQVLKKLLLSFPPPRGLIVTNDNHWRNSQTLAEDLSVPIFARASDQSNDDRPPFVPLPDARLGGNLAVLPIEGAAPGEIALHFPADGGTLIIGDALINFEPYGFTFLPAKYCSNQKEMRRSLLKLLNYEVERIFFAHGTPLLARAGSRLRELLDNHE